MSTMNESVQQRVKVEKFVLANIVGNLSLHTTRNAAERKMKRAEESLALIHLFSTAGGWVGGQILNELDLDFNPRTNGIFDRAVTLYGPEIREEFREEVRRQNGLQVEVGIA